MRLAPVRETRAMCASVYPRRPVCGRTTYRSRQGIATFWLLLFVPVFLILLGLVVNVANLWLARVELENALEAAALAAVKEWANPSDDTTIPQQVGIAYAAANTVRGWPVILSGGLVFGAVYQASSDDPTCPNGVILDTTLAPDCAASPPRHFGVLAQASVSVPTLWSTVLGSGFAQGTVKSYAVAIYECDGTQPRLIRINKLIFE